MKAVEVIDYGSSDVLKINENTPMPVPGESQVLVKVKAASINPFDVKIRSGVYKGAIPIKFPYIIGGDFAGVITEIRKDVSEFKIGDEVFGSAIILNGGSGAFVQFVVSNVKNMASKPKNIDFIKAASLPLVGSSAIQALEEHIGLRAGQKILIHGGAGGIGSIAIQLAKHLGAYVVTTVGEKDKEFVSSLGVDRIFDYKNEKFEEIISDYDAVYDTVGGKVTDLSFKVLKKGGIIVSMLGMPNEELAKSYEVKAIGQTTHTNNEHLSRLSELVENGAVKPQLDKVFPLEKAKEAFDYQEKGKPRGKVVLEIS